MTRKRVVCIGGGTGQSQLLHGLSRYPLDLTALVGVTDNGGHSGILRDIFGIPQVGDIRNCLSSLTDKKNLFSHLLQYRFAKGDLNGVSLGNLLVVALIEMKGSLSAGIRALGKELGVKHTILPVSDHSTQICARLTNGKTIRGEWEILQRKPRTPIKKVFHQPKVDALPEALTAIRKADLIVFCPGSFLTAIVSAILPRGFQEALKASRAKKVLIGNIMTNPGQTDKFTARDHLDTFSDYLGFPPDIYVVNTGVIPPAWLRPYKKQGASPVKIDLDDVTGVKILRRNLVEPEKKDVFGHYLRSGDWSRQALHLIRHDPAKIARILNSLVKSG